MYTGKNVSWRIVLRFAWKTLLFFTIYDLLVTFLFVNFNWRFLSIPFVPLSVAGLAVSFYLGFKNNSSYERLWEARRIWGNIVNSSRTFAVYVLDFIKPSNEISEADVRNVQRQLIMRHLAYINSLRIQLRRRSVWQNDDRTAINVVQNLTHFQQCGLTEELAEFLPDAEIKEHAEKFNPATHIMRRQSRELHLLNEKHALTEYKHVEISRMLADFYNQQGACERIKSFPFPRQYAYFSKVFVWIFILMLPLGLINQFQQFSDDHVWLTIPFSIVISWIFSTMEITGDTSENPFENAINDVPMTAICRNIEIDLRQLLGESEPPKPIASENNILM